MVLPLPRSESPRSRRYRHLKRIFRGGCTTGAAVSSKLAVNRQVCRMGSRTDAETLLRAGGPLMAGMRDVARHAGVSVATVSRVLSGSAPVRPDTRARVEQAMRRMLYVAPGGRQRT